MGGQRTVGSVIRGMRASYSHMSDSDAHLFYSTMNALLVYANERLRVVEPGRLRERPENPDMLYECGGEVAEALWRHRALVEDFVASNPLGLSDRQLEAARAWRSALRDMFVVVDANEDRAVYMNRDRLFAVGAMQDPADAHVHHIPSLMLLTLVPFKGGIVTDGKTLHLSPRPATWALPTIAAQVAEACARRPVTTARQLIAYASAIPDDENRVTESFQRTVDRGFASGALM